MKDIDHKSHVQVVRDVREALLHIADRHIQESRRQREENNRPLVATLDAGKLHACVDGAHKAAILENMMQCDPPAEAPASAKPAKPKAK